MAGLDDRYRQTTFAPFSPAEEWQTTGPQGSPGLYTILAADGGSHSYRHRRSGAHRSPKFSLPIPAAAKRRISPARQTSLPDPPCQPHRNSITLDALEEAKAKYEEYSKQPDVVYGDIDANTKVEAADALQVLQYSVKLVTFTDDQLVAADVDGDNAVNPSDALLILQYCVELIDHFPVEK